MHSSLSSRTTVFWVSVLLFVQLSCSTPEAEVQLLDAKGSVLAELLVYTIADTEEERRQGLIGKEVLPAGEALLLKAFVADEMCISNRQVPFGIVAIWAGPKDEQGRSPVITVEPFDAWQDEARCHPGAQYVLEVSSVQLDAALETASLRW